MLKNETITDIQQARAIISSVGKSYEKMVDDKLRTLFYNSSEDDDERNAQKEP